MRANIHNARVGKNGVFSPKHPDRNFDTTKADHIDQERICQNWYWHCMPEHPELTFDEVEAKFYEEHCSAHLDKQNFRYQQQRHTERVRSINEYRTAKQTCPEESILIIGCKGDSVPPRILKNICVEFVSWEEKTFPGLHVLDLALHVDEQGAPHIHERKVWLYKDKDGFEAVGQNQVLEKSGVPLPHPEQPRSRYNNRKQTYSKWSRQKFLDICQEHGLEIEETPREKSKSGLSQIDYQATQAEARAKEFCSIIKHLQEKSKSMEQEENLIDRRLHRKENEFLQIENDISEAKKQLAELHTFLHEAEKRRAFEIFQERERERVR